MGHLVCGRVLDKVVDLGLMSWNGLRGWGTQDARRHVGRQVGRARSDVGVDGGQRANDVTGCTTWSLHQSLIQPRGLIQEEVRFGCARVEYSWRFRDRLRGGLAMALRLCLPRLLQSLLLCHLLARLGLGPALGALRLEAAGNLLHESRPAQLEHSLFLSW